MTTRLCRLLSAVTFLTAVSVRPCPGADAPARYTDTVTTQTGKTLTFEMVRIPGGRFTQGSPADEPGRQVHEGPQRAVTLSPFYLCTTETTQDLFLAYYAETVREKEEAGAPSRPQAADVDAITGPTPVYGDMTMGYGPHHPALGLTWDNAVTFCRWLRRQTGKPYRLPTEAEWEYACRAGTTDARGLGDSASDLAAVAWYEANADRKIHEVARKSPNAWGLYDMLGNVNEWVQDFYAADAYAAGPATNPRGPAEGTVHVARGGSYDSPPEELRCAARAFEEDWWRFGDPQIPHSRWWMPDLDIIGFRVACDAASASTK